MLARFTTVAATLVMLFASIPCAFAQTPEAKAKESGVVFDHLADIDKLRVLNPLKLKPEQIDKLVAAVQKARVAYDASAAAAAETPIHAMAREIQETRAKVLSGASIPRDFDAKVKKLQSEFDERRAELDAKTLASLASVVKGILSKEQFTTAARLARDLTKKDDKPTLRGEDDQFFNFYVMGTFIVYGRIVPLLNDMKAALASPR